jgi:hypothetical protein
MAVGLRVQCQDGSGALQVDENYRNLFLRAKANAATTSQALPSSGFGVSFATITIPNCSQLPLIAIRSADYSFLGEMLIDGSGTVTVRVYIVGAIGTAFTWYAFDALTSATTVGVKVWNAAGQLVFDAGAKPMRITDGFSTPGDSGTTNSYTPGRTYAVVNSAGVWVSSFSGSPTGYVVRVHGAKVTNETVQIAPVQIVGQAGSSFEQRRPSYSLVVDVTNY